MTVSQIDPSQQAFEHRHHKMEVVFKPSALPFFGGYLALLIVPILIFFATLGAVHAMITSMLFCALLHQVIVGGFFTKFRALNAIGAINAVTLTPKGIEHRSWEWLRMPKYYSYSWNDFHSIRAHRPSYGHEMIAFTPVKPEVGKFYRSSFDGSYGVPRYGNGETMLATMQEYHRRYRNQDRR